MARRSAGGWPARLAAALALLVATACTPPPPPVVAPGVTSVPAEPSPARALVVGVDDLSGGFNPHTLADLTPTASAVAGLLLPSAFRQAADGSWQIDYRVLESARVSATDPITITYRIRLDAAWSDGAPIAAEDFAYLAEQMRTQPGVVTDAGYQLIDEVVSADGGKTVRVVLREPYPGWRTLFRELLPAHLLKDAPGGWTDALDEGLPVSGGPFVLTPVDPARRELVLARNDRYWDTPAWADRLVLRQLTDGALAEAVSTGSVQAALFGRPDRVTLDLLAESGVTGQLTVPQPSVAQVVLRSGSTALSDPRVRAAVAAALDRSDLVAVGAGGGPSAGLVADAQVLAPSREGYAPTRPENVLSTPDLEAAARLLTEAGYARMPEGWTRDGGRLELVIAAPEGADPFPMLAARVSDQLAALGIGTTVVTPPADQLYAPAGSADAGASPQESAAAPEAAPPPAIDIAVIPLPAGGDPATLLASAHGCPIEVPEGRRPPRDIAGSCDSSLQPAIEGALTGKLPVGATIAGLEPVLWQRAVAIPLYQQASVFVPGSALLDVVPAPLVEGPLDRADRWRLPAGDA
ncbi:MAG: ABC transporter family substrate-binding protein [Actinomycetota bacterium]|nr:ABC transporter family substrate-binding protein [Actinomycetota bacterium]